MIFSVRTAPHEHTPGGVITIGNHAEAFLTDGSTILVDLNAVWDGFRMPAFAVKVDESPDFSVLEQPVGGEIVHGGIKADILDVEIRHKSLQFIKGGKEAD